jgi:hypothetical protein
VGHAGAHLVKAQGAQVLGHDAGGTELAVAQLGVGVEIAPPGDDPRFGGLGCGVDLGGQRTGGDVGDGHGVPW